MKFNKKIILIIGILFLFVFATNVFAEDIFSGAPRGQKTEHVLKHFAEKLDLSEKEALDQLLKYSYVGVKNTTDLYINHIDLEKFDDDNELCGKIHVSFNSNSFRRFIGDKKNIKNRPLTLLITTKSERAEYPTAVRLHLEKNLNKNMNELIISDSNKIIAQLEENKNTITINLEKKKHTEICNSDKLDFFAFKPNKKELFNSRFKVSRLGTHHYLKTIVKNQVTISLKTYNLIKYYSNSNIYYYQNIDYAFDVPFMKETSVIPEEEKDEERTEIDTEKPKDPPKLTITDELGLDTCESQNLKYRINKKIVNFFCPHCDIPVLGSLGKSDSSSREETNETSEQESDSESTTTPSQKITFTRDADGCYTTNEEQRKLISEKNGLVNTIYHSNDYYEQKRTMGSIVQPTDPNSNQGVPSLNYDDIDEIFKDKGSLRFPQEIKDSAPAFYNLGLLYNIDPVFILSIFKAEKSMFNMNSGAYSDTLVKKKDIGGVTFCRCGGVKQGTDRYCTYPTLEQGIEAVYLNLQKGTTYDREIYKNKNFTQVARTWNNNDSYVANMSTYLNDIYRYANK